MADEKIKPVKPGWGCLTCPLPSCSSSCNKAAKTKEETEQEEGTEKSARNSGNCSGRKKKGSFYDVSAL